MNIKNKDGVTLLELMIAIGLIVTVMSFGSGIFLSQDNLSRDLINSTQVHRNAQLALMHIDKNVRNAASGFSISTDGTTLSYRRYSGATDIYSEPSITSQYVFTSGELRYYSDTTSSSYSVVSNNIQNCTFSITPTDGVVLHIEVAAVDENGENACTLNTDIEATTTSSPSVFTV